MLFKILKGDSSRISTDVTPFHEGYAYVTANDGGFYIDMNNGTTDERIRINPSATQVTMKKWNADDFLPKKGDLITMNLDGTDSQYRILKKVNGNVYEVLRMEDLTSVVFNSDGTGTYSGGALDTYLNTTWYNTLSTTAKGAIVPKNIAQDSWYWDVGTSGSGNPQYTGTLGESAPGSTSYTIGKGSDNVATIGDRYVYVLNVQEVLDYLSDSSMLVDTSAMLRNQNIWKMFFNTTDYPAKDYLWLRSTLASNSTFSWMVDPQNGALAYNEATISLMPHPAFQIDLSKVDFAIND